MRTSHKLGIRTVAVYSEADRNAMHVAMADEARCIGPPPSGESYLRQDRIVEVAKATGAQAIHPGYGFLSENKGFAELCQREGLEFIGPPPTAIEKMGTKRVSKQIMSQSSVPIVPGYFGEDQTDQRLTAEANSMGFPVMIKADLGGGGKGMRIVHSPSDFQSSLDSCRSEALKSFGDEKVLLEKFVSKPRHVEVQIFADKHGNTIHLFERDCSVQRRHQKIIEEAPAPDLRPEVREKIWSAAVRAAQAVGYVGAGTVEFILDAEQNFYFMEMNTRLQVEHPVTEMITGTDLVDWQIRVAAGAKLPVNQSDLRLRGHAFEARIYAENPISGTDFLPSPGLLHYLVPPPEVSGSVRIDTGVRQGDHVTTFYDPMIAKLVVWAGDRRSALKRLVDSLKQYQVAGVSTNVGFLGRLASHQSFQEGDVHTGFIEQHESQLFPAQASLPDQRKMEGVLALLALEQWQKTDSLSYEHDPFSPFAGCSGGRLNTRHRRRVALLSQGDAFEVDVTYNGTGSYTLSSPSPSPSSTGEEPEDGTESIPSWSVSASGRLSREGGSLVLSGFVGEEGVRANVAVIDDTLHIFTADGGYEVAVPKPAFIELKEKAETGGTRSPKYPSTVTKVHVKPGDDVTRGSILMTVEGMKMETNILAVKDGIVKTVFFTEKDNVPAFSMVMEFEDEEQS